MKKILIATTALIATAGVAAAEVAVGGNARMGITTNAAGDLQFTSRFRVTFAGSGETDGGLTFGASARADQYPAAVGNAAMSAGSVYISGAFGKLSFGDNDSAANALVGNVSGVGFTGLGDANELGFIGQTDTSVLYTYSMDALTVALSAGQLNTVATATSNQDAMSVAVKYAMGDYYAAVGYETAKVGVAATKSTQTSLALGGNFGPVSAKVVYAKVKGVKAKVAVSGTYKMDAISVTAFYAEKGALDAYGIGASYDLGGGASVIGGISKTKTLKTRSEIGVSMSF